jgi:hypothetical protein
VEDDQIERAAELARSTPLSAAAIHREIRAESRQPISYRRIAAAVRSARQSPDVDRSATGLASRILTLLDRELAAAERNRGKVDLDRLDKIAATLRRIEPLQPKAEKERKAGLSALLPTEDQAESETDRRSDEPEGLSEAAPSIAAFAAQLR